MPAQEPSTSPLAILDGRNVNTSGIVIDPEYPHSFRYRSGERFFPMGDTAYFLIAQPKNVIAHYIDVRRAHKFNFIRMMAMADGFWPFGGTPGKPDYTVDRRNRPAKVGLGLRLRGGAGHEHRVDSLGLRNRRRRRVVGKSSESEFVDRHAGQALQRRPNLFMFTIANEFERYPDGQYHYDPSDVDWARRVAARIRKLDAVHPIGCHPSVWITDQDPPAKGQRPFASYKGFTQRRPQVVWPLWEGSEVNLNVTQNNEGVQPRTWGNFDGAGRGLTYYPTTWQGVDYPVKWTATVGISRLRGWRTASPKTGRMASRFSTPSSATSTSRDTNRERAMRHASAISRPR